MTNLKLYCSTLKYYKILNKLPSYIIPVGLGDNAFPDTWETEKNGINIFHVNKYYAQLTMYYWMWKNKLKELEANDFIGSCEHRSLWLNRLYTEKQKFSPHSLYNKLLQPSNNVFNISDIIIVQPVVFTEKNLFEDFEEVHGKNILKESIMLLPKEHQEPFKKYLKKNILHTGPFLITKKKYFEEYCELIFPWIDECFKYCSDKNILNGYNQRIPAFLAERFTSYWADQFKNKSILSCARLGNFHLSNKLNTFMNTTKLPFTFYQYPTIRKY
jgi:hypothetical protein